MSLFSSIMSLRKLVLRRDINVENKDINLDPWLFHVVQEGFLATLMLYFLLCFFGFLFITFWPRYVVL
jgi:hypothetical protein